MKLTSILPPFILAGYEYLISRIQDEQRFKYSNVSKIVKIWKVPTWLTRE